jgi:hypothetical protein
MSSLGCNDVSLFTPETPAWQNTDLITSVVIQENPLGLLFLSTLGMHGRKDHVIPNGCSRLGLDTSNDRVGAF